MNHKALLIRAAILPILLLAAGAGPARAGTTETVRADICVYGGTAAGVAAAVTAAKQGRSVLLVEPGRHLGGMTSGGLGWTDFGNKGAIGGLSRQFYKRLGAVYGKDEVWAFEPHVAENLLNEMVREAKVRVLFEHRLGSVAKRGRRIRRLILEKAPLDALGAPAPTAIPGVRVVVEAPVFIDATYEGDLMARAGVRYTVGREPVWLYHEPLNGIRERTPAHQFSLPVDPYVNPGYPSSGLLPFVQPSEPGRPGQGDGRVQAYNFRLCLTQNPENRVPITAPEGYDPARYELLARHVEALVEAGRPPRLRALLKIDMVPNGKTDINNNGAVSTDFIGGSWGYADGDWPTRSRIWKAHQEYIRGLLYFLATSPRLPETLRQEMGAWGFCKDEFQDTGGWPHALYIREARRMVSSYVVTEADCEHRTQITDSVGLGSYNMDSHNCERWVKGGQAQNEGDVQVGPKGPYPMPYRSIVPRADECENLIVPVCVSASHIAYGSIRMEPVFMVLGESAGTAAGLALDHRVPVQRVDIKELQAKLRDAGQVLEWASTPAAGGGPTAPRADPATLPGIVVDDEAAAKIGEWIPSTSVQARRAGIGYLHDGDENKGKLSIAFTPNLPAAGEYEVVVLYPPNPNRATNVPVTLTVDGKELKSVLLNQKLAENDGHFSLGRFTLPAGRHATVTLSNRNTDGHVVAEGVQFLPAAK